jgi:hypothetical protein
VVEELEERGACACAPFLAGCKGAARKVVARLPMSEAGGGKRITRPGGAGGHGDGGAASWKLRK